MIDRIFDAVILDNNNVIKLRAFIWNTLKLLYIMVTPGSKGLELEQRDVEKVFMYKLGNQD